MTGYWTVYWFQGIACFFFASTATFSGVTGSALMLPWLIMGYAVLGVPEITAHQAIVASILLETVAATIGIRQYHARRLIDFRTVKTLGVFVLPAAVVGALVSHLAPERILQVAYSLLMLVVAYSMIKRVAHGDGGQQHAAASEDDGPDRTDAPSGENHATSAPGLGLQRWISAGGAFSEGLISAGTGEVTVPGLILRSRYAIAVAVATSLVLVIIADFSAAITHVVQFALGEGLGEIPWNVIVWGAPGMGLGAYVGSRLQGRIPQNLTMKIFAAVFVVIGATFLVFTLFR